MRHFLNLTDAGADGVAAMLDDAMTARRRGPAGRRGASMPTHRWPVMCWR